MKKIFTVLMMVLLAAMLIVSCDNSSKEPAKTYTVSFDVNEGIGTFNPQTSDSNGKISKPTAIPSHTGWGFLGWSTVKDGTTAFNFETDTITADTTLYAMWKKSYSVGDTGPAGGKIFYVVPESKGTKTSNYGEESLTWKYLEAASADLSENYQWNTSDSYFGTSTGDAIGTGWSNTRILNSSTFAAAEACRNYGNNSDYDDWFLPSQTELAEVYNKRNDIGGFDCDATTGGYWSSSKDYYSSECIAYMINFSNGVANTCGRTGSFHIRPIRAF